MGETALSPNLRQNTFFMHSLRDVRAPPTFTFNRNNHSIQCTSALCSLIKCTHLLVLPDPRYSFVVSRKGSDTAFEDFFQHLLGRLLERGIHQRHCGIWFQRVTAVTLRRKGTRTSLQTAKRVLPYFGARFNWTVTSTRGWSLSYRCSLEHGSNIFVFYLFRALQQRWGNYISTISTIKIL